MSQAPSDYRPALEAVERILNSGGDADDVLGAVLAALHARGVEFGRVRLVADNALVDGPAVGEPTSVLAAPVAFAGETVGVLELAVVDARFAARVATLISPYVSSARGCAREPGGLPREPGGGPSQKRHISAANT